MIRNLRFIALLIKLKLTRMMMYRLNFFGAFLADGSYFLVQLLVFEAIYSKVESIGGWGRGQMLVFVGTFSIINALNMLIYFFGVVTLPDKIKRGDLDQYMTKPVDTLLWITFESINPGCILLLFFSIWIVYYGISIAGIVVTLPLGLAYTAITLLMTLLWYDMEVILRSIPFFVISANGIHQLEGQLIEMNFKVPGILFQGGFKLLFYYLLPYGIMSTVPTELLFGSLTYYGLIHALTIVAVFTAFTLWFWRKGLNHYNSASS